MTRLFAAILLCNILYTQSCKPGDNSETSKISQNQSTQKNIVRLKLTGIKDDEITHSNLIIFRMPENWLKEETIKWDLTDPGAYPCDINFTASSPDGKASLRMYSTKQFSHFQNQNSTNIEFDVMDDGEELELNLDSSPSELSPEYFHGIPSDAIEALLDYSKSIGAISGDFIVTKQSTTNASFDRASQTFLNQNRYLKSISKGVFIKGEERINGKTFVTNLIGLVQGYEDPNTGNFLWIAMPITAKILKDEEENQNDKILQTMLQSIKYNPTLLNAVAKIANMKQKGINIAQNPQYAFGNMPNNGGNNLLSQYNDYSFQSGSVGGGLSGNNNEIFSQYIRGVENYSDGNGNTYEIPSGYQQVWSNGSGDVMLSNSYGYNPNTDSNVGGSWSALTDSNGN